jgi:hypothetical protein
MQRRTRFEAAMAKRKAVKSAEKAGTVADSKEVRMAIMARVHSGEITLAQAQIELTQIIRNSKADGKMTREQAFNAG